MITYAASELYSGGCKSVNCADVSCSSITALDHAREEPELAILSAVAHARDDNTDDAADIALAGLAACDGLDIDRAARYSDFIFSVLEPAVWQKLDRLMTARKYQPQSDFARYHAAQGRKEGEEAGQRAIVLRLLTKRFGPLDPQALKQVEQASVSTLELWADRILSADTLDQILAGSGHEHE